MSLNDKQMQKVMWEIIATSPNSRLAKLFTQAPVDNTVLHDYQQLLHRSHHKDVPKKPIGSTVPRKRSKHATAANKTNGGRRTRRNKKHHKKSRKSKK